MGRGLCWGEAPKRWGGKSQPSKVLPPVHWLPGRFLCAVSASLSFFQVVVRPAILVHPLDPLGVDVCHCTAFIKGDATPWPPLLPPGFPCATRLKPRSAIVHHQSQSKPFITLPPMTACIFNSTALPSQTRTRHNFLHFVTNCQREPTTPANLQCAGAHFCVQL